MDAPTHSNVLYYGDNLGILKKHIPDACVDLIYLDPPFNSSRSYNVLFRDESGRDSDAQIVAFEDTWHWGHKTEELYHDLITDAPAKVSATISALMTIVGRNQMMAYLVMMAARLVELHRVLKPTGSLYLHCDPTASHYLKIILDSIFGAENFRNEIVWQRTSSHNDSKKWSSIHDIIFYYTKSNKYTWNPVYTDHDPDYVSAFYRHKDERGIYRQDHIIRSASMGERPNLVYEYKGYKPRWGWRVVREKLEALDADNRIEWSKSGRPYLKRYLHEQKGTPIKSVITDIHPVGAQAAERMGYPTQKPESLLERIVKASSNEGDLVLDPFAGCGTTIAAAQKLGRRWIGIDITHLGIALLKYRLQDAFKLAANVDYRVVGEPTSVQGARELATNDRYQFQWWALSLLRAKPLGGSEDGKGKKGKDRGIDGLIHFLEYSGKSGKPETKTVLIQVKSGKVKSGDVRDLVGTLERENGAIGVFVTLEAPSKDMQTEAVSAGFYTGADGVRYPRIQIATIADLLDGKGIAMPTRSATLKAAPAHKDAEGMIQKELL